jgi:hypothetical protein
MFIKFTYVDSVTGESIHSAPTGTVPVFPALPGLIFSFALASKYPIDVPEFFGICDDNADTTMPGVLGVISETEFHTTEQQEIAAQLVIQKSFKKQAVATKRSKVEQGGITVDNGVRILTAKEDQDRIDTALNNMERYSLVTVDFKAADGVWISATYDGLKTIGQAVVSHVQACFTAERMHGDRIDALPDSQAVAKYDLTTGWPAN